MTIASRLEVFAAKVEGTPGTAETLTSAEGAYNIIEMEFNANIEISDRPIQGSFRRLPGVAGAHLANCSFSIELIGTGAGGVPPWATVFLAACGVVNSTGTLTPRDEAPGANVKTLTIGLYEGGRRKLMRGAMGNAVFNIIPGQAVRIDFDFTGVLDSITDTAMITPTYPTLGPIRAGNGLFNINSAAQVFSACTFDLGNVIEVRPTVTNAQGALHAIITDRNPTFNIDPEAKLMSGNDYFADWIAGTTRALAFECENATDNFAINAPAVQRTSIANGDRNGLRLDTQVLACRRDGTNAEFNIVFSAP
jgi:hypothetical protein